jgi:hypothetical protein
MATGTSPFTGYLPLSRHFISAFNNGFQLRYFRICCVVLQVVSAAAALLLLQQQQPLPSPSSSSAAAAAAASAAAIALEFHPKHVTNKNKMKHIMKIRVAFLLYFQRS